MKRILIVGPDFYNYNKSVQDAFASIGYETKVISYIENLVRYIDIIRYHYMPKIGVNSFFNGYKKKINMEIKNTFDRFLPDMVFVIKGGILDKDLLSYMDNTIKVLWMMDSVKNIKGIQNTINDYDYRLAFEKTDVEILNNNGVPTYFMPMGLDDAIYFPKYYKHKKIDITFIGALYDGRKEFLEKLIVDLKDYNIKVYGKYLSFKNPRTFLNYFIKGFRNSFTNKTISPNEVNEIYNNSKIAINIHHGQSVYGCNPRFLEILGSGTFQIVDDNIFIKENFVENKEFVSFKNYDDLINKINYYIANEKKRVEIAEDGYQKAIENHTFKARILDILNVINFS